MSKKSCSNGCKITFEPSVKFCTECGGKTVESVAPQGQCSCGFVNNPANKFCGNCGKNMTTGLLSPRGTGVVTSETSIRPSAVKQGAAQVTGKEEFEQSINNNAPSSTSKQFYQDYLQPVSHQTGLKKAAYIPPDHTTSIPVVKELADGCYDGKVIYKMEHK